MGADRRLSDKVESGYWDRYNAILPDTLLTILELGVDEGLSLELWRQRYPNARIVGIDNRECPHPEGVWFTQMEQTDRDELESLSRVVGGWGLVVDDASHLGAESAKSFQILWPFVHPGGFYVVEDWMTAYWGWWPDGAEPALVRSRVGHDVGMAAFVKSLVDLLADPSSEVESIAYYPGQVFIRKRA